jgi:hypothetical protein
VGCQRGVHASAVLIQVVAEVAQDHHLVIRQWRSQRNHVN